MGFGFVAVVPFLPSCCGFFFVCGCRVSFLEVSSVLFCFLVDGCSAVSCDLGVFERRGELTSFYPAILPANQSRNLYTCNF